MLRTAFKIALLVAIVFAVEHPATAPAYAQDRSLIPVAGTGSAGWSGDGGRAPQAQLSNPTGVAVAPDGTLYIADTGNHRVRVVAPDGTISTIAGTGQQGHAATVITDGTPATGVALSAPTELAVGPDGTLYIDDAGLHRVLARDIDGRLRVVAGNGRDGAEGDGGPAVDAAIGGPHGLAVGRDGTLFVSDPDHHRVRAIAPDGTISTIAGNGGQQLTAAGGPARAIPVPAPTYLSVDAQGALWITDGLVTHTLRDGTLATITRPDGMTRNRWAVSNAAHWPPPEQPLNNVTTLATGHDGVYLIADRTLLRLEAGGAINPLMTVDLTAPGQIAVGPTGTVYIVDVNGNQVLSVHPASARPATAGGGLPWWPFALAGVAIVGAALWLTRRHTHRRPSAR